MRSIRFFLLFGVLAVIILSSFIAALRGYQASMSQAESLFDNELLDLARLVENLDLARLDEHFRLGNNMAFQVWLGDQLLGASSHAPATPMMEKRPGFDESNFDGYRWRTFARIAQDGRRWVMVAERIDLRFALAENVVLESVMPILLSIPLIGLLIWAVITVGLRPLSQLSAELKHKPANDLSPLLMANSRRELEQVIQSVNAFLGRLQAVMEREKRFSADAAHELRTPISVLKVQLHNLATELGEDHEALAELESGVDRMQHLVEQLLSLYRMTPEQFVANMEDIDLYALAEDVMARLYARFEDRAQQLELTGESLLVSGDRFALDTLLSNLLSNACKYTQPGGEIRVTVTRRGRQVVLRVEDNGPGIPATSRDRVFERFYREPDQQGSETPGCGLGLTIVAHVAALHGAKPAIVGSAFGQGCGVEVVFNAAGGQA